MLIRLRNSDIPKISVMKRKLLQEALRKTILNTRIFGTIFFRVRNRHQRCSMKKGVLKNFARSTGKHLCQSLFFNLNFAKFLRTPFLQNTTGQLLLIFKCYYYPLHHLRHVLRNLKKKKT